MIDMFGNSALSWGASNSQCIQSTVGGTHISSVWTQVFSSGSELNIRK